MSVFGIEPIEKCEERQRAQSWERRKLGLELRQKYEMYFVALAFTLAGLAVQSAKPSAVAWVAAVEVFGWIALAVAGLVGLWRVGQLWLVLVGVAEFADPEESPHETEARQAGLVRLDRRVRRWATPQFVLFGGGLSLLMLARASAIL